VMDAIFAIALAAVTLALFVFAVYCRIRHG
jgi:hypothetical protein